MKTSGLLSCVVLVIACGGKAAAPARPAATAPDVAEPGPAPVASPPAPAAARSLFERLGGTPAITAVVEEFVSRSVADPLIKDRFFNVDAANFKRLLVEFVSVATGAQPPKYSGRDMTATHAGMELVGEEFDEVVSNLGGALDKFNVPAKEKGELIAALGPLKPVIVAPADHLKPIDAGKLAAVTKLAATVKDKAAADLLAMAVTAGTRGQRSYAEQLFSRAELLVGTRAVGPIASTFRVGAPPRIATALKTLPADTAPQPKTVGGSEADEPDRKPAAGSLTGTLKIDGKPPTGLGVVMLWPEKGGKKRTPKIRMIEQRDRTFAPHIMAVPVGSTVSFPNFDAIFHNVFSLSKIKAFDLGLYKSGETREIKFDKPGIIRLGCNIHSSMSAYVVVVDAPHYVIVGDDGSFSFKSLAPGKYKAQAWSEAGAEPATSEVVIKAGENAAELDVKAGVITAPPDKFGAPR